MLKVGRAAQPSVSALWAEEIKNIPHITGQCTLVVRSPVLVADKARQRYEESKSKIQNCLTNSKSQVFLFLLLSFQTDNLVLRSHIELNRELKTYQANLDLIEKFSFLTLLLQSSHGICGFQGYP